MAARKPRVLVIGTGGTMSARLVKGGWKYGEITGEELIKSTPRIKEHFQISATNLFRMDSSDIKPAQWTTLANAIYYSLGKYDGIVVAMGTDTLAFVAAAVSLMVQGAGIPIVFTGSRADPVALNTDATRNLRQAITVACETDIAETMVVFNGRIIRGTRAKMVNASEFDAFQSAGEPDLGKIRQCVRITGSHRKRGKKWKPLLNTNLEEDVAILKVYPGFDGNRIRHLVDYGARGIVIEGFGIGNIPLADNRAKEGLKYAREKNVPVVVTTASLPGEDWQYIYSLDIGKRLRGLGVIVGYDMTTETAYVKLMWCLGQTRDIGKVREMMQKNYVGEITLPKEEERRRK